MLAYHNDRTIKRTYLARVRTHRAADEIIQGIYWERGKGCAVGCTIHGADHTRYETELGIPRVLARLEDQLFETMTPARAKAWPGEFLNAIPVGADLSLVWPHFAMWLLTNPAHGVLQYAQTSNRRRAIERVANLYTQQLNGNTPARTEWETAANDAVYAANDAVYAANAAVYYDAAYDAAYAAVYAAYAAAYDAAYAANDAVYAAYAAAYDAAYAANDAAYAANDAAYAANHTRAAWAYTASRYLLTLLKTAPVISPENP